MYCLSLTFWLYYYEVPVYRNRTMHQKGKNKMVGLNLQSCFTAEVLVKDQWNGKINQEFSKLLFIWVEICLSLTTGYERLQYSQHTAWNIGMIGRIESQCFLWSSCTWTFLKITETQTLLKPKEWGSVWEKK